MWGSLIAAGVFFLDGIFMASLGERRQAVRWFSAAGFALLCLICGHAALDVLVEEPTPRVLEELLGYLRAFAALSVMAAIAAHFGLVFRPTSEKAIRERLAQLAVERKALEHRLHLLGAKVQR